MTFTPYILYFFLFSLIGWVLDSAYCSYDKRRFINSGYFWELPLCPIYGFGGVALLLLTEYLQGYPFIMVIIISGLMLTSIEYIGGIFCVTVLRERLWDYSSHKWNYHGHIDIFHCLCWILLTIVFYFFLYSILSGFQLSLQSSIDISPLMDKTIFFLFCLAAFIFTVKRRHTRLKKIYRKPKKRKRYSK